MGAKKVYQEILTVNDLVERYSLTAAYVYLKASTGEFPTLNFPGRILRFDAKAIEEIIFAPKQRKAARSLKTERVRNTGRKPSRRKKEVKWQV